MMGSVVAAAGGRTRDVMLGQKFKSSSSSHAAKQLDSYKSGKSAVS